ncbi:MAG: type II secretion system protein GspK [Thermogemmata sp.]|uniref:General secretion pathway protein GspK n=1 Tax=Thermogemmata fonticola TaxID=2755323 RepID=A0A7V8VCK8_9BACT|nr:type II secretion system protein GspK [Thermogemmata fonticola]MBA2225481.1 general secretion pathway protein GspK [Thermogemmata fonticola]
MTPHPLGNQGRLRGIGRDPRPGYVLIAVLIVILVLSLVAYRFSDAMVSELRAGVRSADYAQVRAAAASGVHYAAALLADPELLALDVGNPYDNPAYFQDIPVPLDPTNPSGKQAYFSIIHVAPLTGGGYQQRFGLADEGGKININALIALDPTGETLYNALLKLPNMTPEIADAIVDWVDSNEDTRPNGAESAYYRGLAQPYSAKNGPLNTLDELLLVKGVTPQLLYGTDRNRNGIDDENAGWVDRGWSDYLTVYGREVNVDSSGILRIWINGDDIVGIYQALLNSGLDADMAAYIVAVKIFGSNNLLRVTDDGQIQSQNKGMGRGMGMGKQQQEVYVPVGAEDLISAVEARLATIATSGRAINSVLDLINTGIVLQRNSRSNPPQSLVYFSPLNDPARRAELLPVLLDKISTREAVEMIPRLNVNTASREALLGLPGLTETDVDNILAVRDNIVPFSLEAMTGAWLLTEAGLSVSKFRNLERLITGTSMVYRVEVVGYFAEGGPTARVEAVIDSNLGAPRILYFRDLGDLDQPRAYSPQRSINP